MKLLLDMNLSPRLVQQLRKQDHIAIHWSEVGDARADDREIMVWAVQHEYVVLTHDLDFGALLASSNRAAPSVIQVRTRDLLSEDYVHLVLDALNQFCEEIEKGALVVVEPHRARVRILPLG